MSHAAHPSGAARHVEFRSSDGLVLRGTFVAPAHQPAGAAVLVHGGGVTRDEGGFFTRLADGLSAAGVASLRFDLRGHGDSEGRQEDLTLYSIANDIRAAIECAQAMTGTDAPVALIAASFSGGITSVFAARHPELVQTLVLLNPLLSYKKRFIDDKQYWHDDHLDEEAARELTSQGYLPHSPTFRLGRALLNEVFYVDPLKTLPEITVPTLFIHGTGDTFIPVDSSRQAVTRLTAEAELMEIPSAQHGFAVYEDPQYREPQTQVWQASVVSSVVEWVARHSPIT